MTCRIIEEWNFVDFFRTLIGGGSQVVELGVIAISIRLGSCPARRARSCCRLVEQIGLRSKVQGRILLIARLADDGLAGIGVAGSQSVPIVAEPGHLPCGVVLVASSRPRLSLVAIIVSAGIRRQVGGCLGEGRFEESPLPVVGIKWNSS